MKPEKITIRKASLKDLPVILGMWKEFMTEHDSVVLKENPRLGAHIARKKGAGIVERKFVQKKIRSRNAMVFIAEVYRKPAGYCLIYIEKRAPVFKIEKTGHIGELFVKKGFRGMKISSKFRDEAIKWFKKGGIEYISITVYKENRDAHSIYKKWGFHDYIITMQKTA
jgi:GNAT superfamily N-acetyltransferase